MKGSIRTIAITILIFSAFSVSGAAHAGDKSTHYRVTITNITREQIISPPILVSHNRKFQLFELGKPAPRGLAALAEDGDTEPLEAYLDSLDSVYDYNVAGGGIMPGKSVTIEIKTKRGFRYLSAAGMLVITNDAFFAMRSVYARSWGNTVTDVRAYDSGTEVNSEDCAFIPGPPCGSGGVRDTDGAEGYVYTHSGIHGVASLDSDGYDWNNPVATVMIERVKGK
jgi:hypothetical protein